MAKRFQFKGQPEPKTPTGENHEQVLVRPLSSLSQRTARAEEAVVDGGARRQQDRIASLAYHLWEVQGKPPGSDRDNWFEAERILRAEAR